MVRSLALAPADAALSDHNPSMAQRPLELAEEATVLQMVLKAAVAAQAAHIRFERLKMATNLALPGRWTARSQAPLQLRARG